MEKFCRLKDKSLMHYGMPRRSGRYPWGSGDRPYQSLEGASGGNERNYHLDKWGKDSSHNLLSVVSNDGEKRKQYLSKFANDKKVDVIDFYNRDVSKNFWRFVEKDIKKNRSWYIEHNDIYDALNRYESYAYKKGRRIALGIRSLSTNKDPDRDDIIARTDDFPTVIIK